MADPVITTVAAEDTPRQETALLQLKASERHWLWKASLRGILCVLCVIALGCAAWLMATPMHLESNPYVYYLEWNDSSLGAVIVLTCSIVYCLICITLPFLLKPPRALHPGIAVGFDLVFWMAFIVVGVFSLTGVFGALDFGSDPTYLPDPNGNQNYNSGYMGSYYLAPNNTWVYNITSTQQDNLACHYNVRTGTADCPNIDPSTIVRDCTPTFSTCQEQDDYVNKMWREKPKKVALEILVNAVEWLAVLFHFTLFVWACVDIHRYNKVKYGSKEKIVADKIIADLESRGLIRVENGVVVHTFAPAQMVQTQPNQTIPESYYGGRNIEESDPASSVTPKGGVQV